MRCACNLESPCTGNHTLVDDHVVDAPQAVPYSIGNLCYRMGVGPLNHECNRLWILDVFLRDLLTAWLEKEYWKSNNEGILFLPKLMLIN